MSEENVVSLLLCFSDRKDLSGDDNCQMSKVAAIQFTAHVKPRHANLSPVIEKTHKSRERLKGDLPRYFNPSHSF